MAARKKSDAQALDAAQASMEGLAALCAEQAPATGAPVASEEAPVAYEEGIAQLEALVTRMEDGELKLEEALATYEQGMALYARLDAVLKQGERRIQMLQARDGMSDADVTVPFEVDT